MRHIELPLSPALALVPGLHEGQRLLIVHDSIMSPGGLDALCQGLHGKLHILNQAGSAPAVTLQHLGSDAHAGAAQHRRQPQIGLCQM